MVEVPYVHVWSNVGMDVRSFFWEHFSFEWDMTSR